MKQEFPSSPALLATGVIVIIGIAIALMFGKPEGENGSKPQQPNLRGAASPEATPNPNLPSGLLTARDVQNQKLAELAKAEEFANLPPAEQLSRLSRISDDTERASQLATLARRLEKEDPAAADALISRYWKRANPTANKSSEFVKALTEERFQNNREEAIAWADALPREAQTIAYLSMAKQWGASDAIAATEWALGIPNPALKNHMVYTIGSGLQESQDIRAGVEWAANLAEFEDAPNHAGLIGNLWGRGDIQATYDWALSLPDSPPKKDAFVGLANALADLSPEVAREWINAFPSDYGIRADSGTGAFYKQPFDTVDETAVYLEGAPPETEP